MVIVGLTGSIGMGKSTAAAMLRQMGVPVYDADAAVHALQAPGGASLPGIEAAFPGVVKDGVLDRQALGARVFGNKAALRRLEAIVHPLVQRRQRAFLRRAALAGSKLVVLDIPLLFEGLGERRVDACPHAVVQGVARLRPVERDGCHVVVDLEGHVAEAFHRGVPHKCFSAAAVAAWPVDGR